MNKVENINLGGFPFIIDEDAYQQLDRYLKAVRAYFSSSSGQDEIMNDIEIRIAEIFHEELGHGKIVDKKIVDAAINRLGRPEQFDSEHEGSGRNTAYEYADSEHKSSGSSDSSSYRTGKKLFRDTDNKVVAGVASGLAAYFGLAEPLWVRIIFVLLLLGGLSGGLIYIIFWALMPEAKTAADKLSMHGKEATFSSIGRIVEEEVSNLGKKFEKWTT